MGKPSVLSRHQHPTSRQSDIRPLLISTEKAKQFDVCEVGRTHRKEVGHGSGGPLVVLVGREATHLARIAVAVLAADDERRAARASLSIVRIEQGEVAVGQHRLPARTHHFAHHVGVRLGPLRLLRPANKVSGKV